VNYTKKLLPELLGRYYGNQFRLALQRHVAEVGRLNREYGRLLR
jgi:hypothetical protein